MSVGRVHSPYSTGEPSSPKSGDDPVGANLCGSESGRVLWGFMSQEGKIAINRTDTDDVTLKISNSGSFDKNWYESGKMSHGMTFTIEIPKDMPSAAIIERLKQLVSSNEKMRWLIATYVSGLSYFDSMTVDDKGAWSNACNSEGVALSRWLSFSRWLWNDPINENTTWQLKETVMQDIGVAADRSLVRYDGDETLADYSIIDKGKFLIDGYKAFKRGGVPDGKLGPLEFIRLKGKQYDRVGLSQYELHPESANYKFPNMSSTCYQGQINDVYNTDTNNFHHSIGYIAFTWQMSRFFGDPNVGVDIAKKHVRAYEKPKDTGDVYRVMNREERDPYADLATFQHEDKGYFTILNGDVTNSLMMIEGASRVYSGEMAIDELVFLMQSKCTCEPGATAKVVDGRLRDPDENPDWLPVEIKAKKLDPNFDDKKGRRWNPKGQWWVKEPRTTQICANYYSNTLEDARMNGKRFPLSESPKVRDAIDKWAKETDDQKRMAILDAALRFAPLDMHLRILYVGTFFSMIRNGGGKWPLTAEMGDKAVAIIEDVNISADISDIKTIWGRYFDRPIPKILEEYQTWSKGECFDKGICGNPLWDHFGKIYQSYCHDEWRDMDPSYKHVHDYERASLGFPRARTDYRNIKVSTASRFTCEYLGSDNTWHSLIVRNRGLITIDGRDTIIPYNDFLIIIDTVFLPQWDKKSDQLTVLDFTKDILATADIDEKRTLELLDLLDHCLANEGHNLFRNDTYILLDLIHDNLERSPEVAKKALSVLETALAQIFKEPIGMRDHHSLLSIVKVLSSMTIDNTDLPPIMKLKENGIYTDVLRIVHSIFIRSEGSMIFYPEFTKFYLDHLADLTPSERGEFKCKYEMYNIDPQLKPLMATIE